MNEKVKYLVLGGIFGLAFPLLATVIAVLDSGDGFGISNIIKLHSTNHLLQIIDLAPFVLGIAGYLIGRKQEKLVQFASGLKKDVVVMDDKVDTLSEQLKDRNEDLKAITYATTHELKSSLRGISSCITFLKEETDEKEIAELEQFLESRINRMDGQLNGLLRYVRATQQQSKMELLDLKSEIASVLNQDKFKQTEVIVDPSLSQLKFDKAKFQTVLHELISNAIEHNSDRSVQVQVSGKDHGIYQSLFIEDNGKGIDPKYFEKVKKLFSTVARKDDLQTDGIGLALVARIIKDAGGKLNLGVSELGGTKIELQILN